MKVKSNEKVMDSLNNYIPEYHTDVHVLCHIPVTMLGADWVECGIPFVC